MRLLLAVFLFFSVFAVQGKAAPPQWSAPRLSSAPVIDGVINDAEWAGAAIFTGFQIFPGFGTGFAPLQTWCYLGWDKNYLYVGFRSRHTYRELLLVNVRGRDAAAYTDEAYEFHIWNSKGDSYFTFITGLASLYDAKIGNPAWNSKGIIYNVSQHDGWFDAELAIPWRDIETVPENGLKMKAVFGHDSLENGLLMSNWHYSSSSYYDTDLAGTLILTENRAVARMLDWGAVNHGHIQPKLELVNPGAAAVELEYRIFAGSDPDTPDRNFLASGRFELAPGGRKNIRPEWPPLRPELKNARITVRDKEQVLADLSFPIDFKPELRGQIQCYPTRHELRIEVDASSLAALGKPANVSANFLNSAGHSVCKLSDKLNQGIQAEFSFDFSRLPKGKYQIALECGDAAGSLLGTAKLDWQNLETTPEWLKNPAAAQMRLPEGFQALELTETMKVLPWGRTYDYAGGFYPLQVTSAGRELLAAPMQLRGKTGGAEFAMSGARVTVKRKDEARIELSATGEIPGFTLEAATVVEFDGLALTTLTITPQKGERVIDSLQFVIPFASAEAGLVHWNDCTSGWSGATPRNWSGTFRPMIWLGSEYAGLYWFAESAAGWSNTDPEKQMVIVGDGKSTVLTINLIDKPVTVNKPLTYTFGFAATPVKAMRPGWLAPSKVSFDPWWDESNQFLHEAVPYEKWRQRAKELRGRGVQKCLKYTQTNYLSFYGDLTAQEAAAKKRPGTHYCNTPEKLFWGNEWEMWPRRGLAGKANLFCTNTAWRELVVAGLRERLTQSGFDGIYFDCAMPRSCNNTLHGCSGGFDLMGQREIRRRLCNIMDGLGLKEGVVYEHSSGNIIGPVMNFATHHYDGEQFSNFVTDYREKLTLERLRAFSIGSNWGHIPEFMAFCRGGDGPTESLMALWALHMPWHCVRGWVAPPGVEARKLGEEFSFDAATGRLGYWENGEIVKGQSAAVKATVYRKPGAMLLVVSNLGDNPAEAELTIDSAALGLDPARLKLVRSLTNHPAPPQWTGGIYRIKLKPASCMMSIFTEGE